MRSTRPSLKPEVNALFTGDEGGPRDAAGLTHSPLLFLLPQTINKNHPALNPKEARVASVTKGALLLRALNGRA